MLLMIYLLLYQRPSAEARTILQFGWHKIIDLFDADNTNTI